MSLVYNLFNHGTLATHGQSFLLEGMPWDAVASAFGSLLNAHTQNRNTDKAIAAQKEENELAYQRGVEMWERQNDYNTPTAQMQRLREAGMNPNLAYGTPNVASPGPSYQPVDTSAMSNKRSVLGTALESPLNQAMIQAQIRNLNADSEQKEQGARKTGAEADYQLTYNQYAEQLLSGQIRQQNSVIELNASQTDLNDMKSRECYSSIQNIMASTDKMKKELDVYQAQIDKMSEETAILKIKKDFEAKHLQAEIHLMYQQAYQAGMIGKMNEEQFTQLAAQSVYNLTMAKENANNAFLQGVVLQNTGSEIQTKIDMNNYQLGRARANEFMDDVDRVTGTFTNIIGALTGAQTYNYRMNYVWK